MNWYEAKQEEKRERLENAAERRAEEAQSAFDRAHKAVEGIPFGQPILVGHHSERRHRADLRRQENGIRKGIELTQEARELAHRAAAVGTGGISSDDPDAIAKLTAEVAELEATQERDKRINALYRKGDADALAAMGLNLDTLRAEVQRSHSWDKQPIPRYRLSNRNNNIRRIRQRIEELTKLRAEPVREPVTIGAATISEETDDDNRIAVRFPKEREDIRAALKARGWRWSPTRGAWVRKRTAGVFDLAVMILQKIES
jgi:hypothetical protein